MAKKPAPSATPTSLVLRTCSVDLTSHGGFPWPGVGEEAVAPDWRKNAECGNGLHGWLYGQGDHSASSFLDSTSKWLVVEVVSADIVMLGGKCKFPRGVVRFVGDRQGATEYLIAHEPRAAAVAVIGRDVIVGEKEAATVGALGHCTAGYSGTATAGNYGTATAGYSGTATAGDSGTATAGNYGTATAGDSGTLIVKWWDEKNSRYRSVIGYVGEDGIEADTPYKLDAKHQLVKAKP